MERSVIEGDLARARAYQGEELSVTQKERDRAKVQADVEAFLAGGGEVKVLERSDTGSRPMKFGEHFALKGSHKKRPRS